MANLHILVSGKGSPADSAKSMEDYLFFKVGKGQKNIYSSNTNINKIVKKHII
jgi:hypothetical protein